MLSAARAGQPATASRNLRRTRRPAGWQAGFHRPFHRWF